MTIKGFVHPKPKPKNRPETARVEVGYGSRVEAEGVLEAGSSERKRQDL